MRKQRRPLPSLLFPPAVLVYRLIQLYSTTIQPPLELNLSWDMRFCCGVNYSDELPHTFIDTHTHIYKWFLWVPGSFGTHLGRLLWVSWFPYSKFRINMVPLRAKVQQKFPVVCNSLCEVYLLLCVFLSYFLHNTYKCDSSGSLCIMHILWETNHSPAFCCHFILWASFLFRLSFVRHG